MTPVQMFRDRWECGHIGTVIFVVQAVLLVPYIIIGMMGGGTTLSAISGGVVPYWFGGAIVALVVMSYVFFGGMRGTAWVNTFQTVLFLCFGAIALIVIGVGMGGFPAAMRIAAGVAGDGAAADPRANLAAILFQLHVHPAFGDRVSAHPDLLPDRAEDGPVQEDGHLLSDLHSRDLAAVRVSRRDGERACRRSADRAEAGSARARWHAGPQRWRRSSATSCASRQPATT